ncbi:MAG: ribosome maturation factor RimP [Cyclobacteriaceae bacterium]
MLDNTLKEKAESLLTDESHFIVDVLVSKGSGKKKVSVYLDGDNGIGIDDCSALSRSLADYIELEELIESAYTLEVSSAGLDQPLKLNRQFVKNIGRNVKTVMKDGLVHIGKLEKVADDKLTLVSKKKKEIIEEEILFSEIKQTTLIITV